MEHFNGAFDVEQWHNRHLEQAFLNDFDESLLGDVQEHNAGSLYSSVQVGTPPPRVASPAVLYQQLINDLHFSEGPRIIALLETCNEDIFSCFPLNEDLYTDTIVFSTNPSDIIESLETSETPEPINLITKGCDLPSLPSTYTELPMYVENVQNTFFTELRVREKAYLRLLILYCKSLLRHLQGISRRSSVGARSQDCEHKYITQFKQSIRLRYYREVAKLARLLYLHLYITVTRQFSWRLFAQQSKYPDVFAAMKFMWLENRQFTCAFHPILCNHGIVLLEGKPLSSQRLREVNYRRRQLGLPLVRCALIEEKGVPLVQRPEFSAHMPRSLGFLTHHIKAKLDVYSSKHSQEPGNVRVDHPYARNVNNINYGSSVEAMIVSPPSPSDILPGDPPQKLKIDVVSDVP
ncbi:transactivator [Cercopithecine alphaherpesvirus 9]|uniref:Tegument protein VP16 homolog n=1 Tax=Cercopithecine herpesvirus 9 (strain DHV) TaxID=36348 RepID=Q9E205_CHV9D|nr:transactivating tegument protein VP16 [Cercopithecine alphaherpesvirus 9]AAG27183.1 transactivator [Cercopithecine alphaherpesvirus 9]